jgi:response regulator of citrate/malate metabolism
MKKMADELDNLIHHDVFGHLKDARFSAQEGAESLEVSMPTFRRYVQSGKVISAEIFERGHCFSCGDLRKFKKSVL